MVVNRILVLVIVCAVLALSGCATIVSGKMQPISVQTTQARAGEVRGANCTLTNDKGSWFVTTPASTVVLKSYSDLVVDCNKDTLAGSSIFKSNANTSVWGNILAGGIIGYAVDASSGSGFDYPAVLSVILKGQAATAEEPSRSKLTAAAGGPTTVPFDSFNMSPPPTSPAEVKRPCYDVALAANGAMRCAQ